MANRLYAKGREGFLNGSIDWDTDDIRVLLVDNTYTPDTDTHDNLDDIVGTARVATSTALTGKTTTDGVADADDVTFTALTGDTVQYAVIYKHTGIESTSRLIALLDTVTGFPYVPSGANLTVQWSNGADRIFRL